MSTAVRVLHLYEPATAGVPTFVTALRRLDLEGVDQAAAGPVGPDFVCGTGSRRPSALTSYYRQALDAVRRFDPDVVHLHGTLAALLTPFLGRHRRIVYSPHAWDTWARSGPARWASSGLHRALGLRHDSLAYLSDDERDEAQRLGYGERCAPLGSLLPRPPAEVRVADSDGLPRVLFVGRSALQKGDDFLPAIAARLAGRARLVAVGAGIAAHPGVEVTGPLDDVRPWYGRSAVLVQPSRYEGLSLVSVEATCHGLPVVGFEVVGMRWLVAGGLGTLVPFGDVDALVDALVGHLGEPLQQRRQRAFVARSMFGPERLGSSARRIYLKERAA